MKALSLVVIGAGMRGQFAYGPYAVSHPQDAKFVAVVEPNDERRNSFQKTHGLRDDQVFTNEDDFFAKKIEADAVLLCTQDRQHFDTAIRLMNAGYHLLLEKPMAPSAQECVALKECAAKNKRILVICHVLRYTKFFQKVKEVLNSGVIGELVTITHSENVGFFHMAHSFVRGNWGNEAKSNPMILAKSCHDMDILLWLAGDTCTSLSSYGGLTHFKPSGAPEGAAKRCIENCPVESTCPYSALKIYLEGRHNNENGWPASVITDVPTRENVIKALQEGPYGRCVYACDNDVVDHQTVNMLFANGVTATFNMSAFTNEVSRTIKLMGTHGEIRGHMEKGEVKVIDFKTGDVTEHLLAPSATGHSGGDSGIMENFVRLVRAGIHDDATASPNASVQSHLMAFAAEKSRKENVTVDMKAFEAASKG